MAENLVYRGHPLRRVDNLVYYGSMADKYIIMMQVLDTEDVKDLKLAKRVSIQLQLTDPNLRSRDRVVRSTEKGSMAEARCEPALIETKRSSPASKAGLLRFSLRNLSKLLIIYEIYNDFIEIKRSKVTFLNVFYRWKCGK